MFAYIYELWSWTYALIITIIVIICTLYMRYKKSQKSIPKVWENQGIKVLKGNSFDFFTRMNKETHYIDHENVVKNGKVFGTYMGKTPILNCSDPEMLKIIMVKDFHIFPDRMSMAFKFRDPILDNMISVITGDQWKRVRSIMSPTFSTGKLRRMRPLIDDCVKTLIENFNEITKNGKSECDIKKLYSAFAMDVVVSVAFGTKIDSCLNEDHPIIINAKQFFNKDMSIFSALKFFVIFIFPKIANLLGLSVWDTKAPKFFRSLIMKIIDERKKMDSNSKRYDFLQLMLEAMNENIETIDSIIDDGVSLEQRSDSCPLNEPNTFVTHNKTLSIDEFVAQSVVFFMGGFDTTSSTICYSVYNIAVNPEIQEQLYEEAKSVIKDNNQIDYDVLQSLKILDAVVSETLRLFPPNPIITRASIKDYIFQDTAIKIPKDTFLVVPIYSLHRDPENFPEPEKFKPERFFPENIIHHPYSYMPFGVGQRNCIAMRLALMETKLALIYTIFHFKFSVSSNTDIPPKCYLGSQFLFPKYINLNVERRN